MKTFLNFRNNLTMLYKNLPDSELGHVMRWRWALDYIAAFQMLVMGRSWGDFKAVFRARRAFSRWRKDFDADRKRILQMATDNDIAERKMTSVLWQYYVKGRKTYKKMFC